MGEVHARIARWAIVQLREPGRVPTIHIAGYIVEHGRLIDGAGRPYVGRSLMEIDIERRLGLNNRRKLIVLVGDPLPPGKLPRDIRVVMRRAAKDWQVRNGAKWERMELIDTQGNGA